jgi:hypothetical protein
MVPLSSRPISQDERTASTNRIAASPRCSCANQVSRDYCTNMVGGVASGGNSSKGPFGPLGSKADVTPECAHVCFGSKADIVVPAVDVRFAPESGHRSAPR